MRTTAIPDPADILFAGDVHGRFDHLIEAVKAIRLHALVDWVTARPPSPSPHS